MLLSQKQALIVEDMDVMRKILVEQLRKMGFSQVYQAENGRRALELLEEVSIDIVLMDWNMPHGGGADLLKAIRLQAKWQYLPVILVTANTHRNMIQEASKYGAVDIIAKPFTTKPCKIEYYKRCRTNHKHSTLRPSNRQLRPV